MLHKLLTLHRRGHPPRVTVSIDTRISPPLNNAIYIYTHGKKFRITLNDPLHEMDEGHCPQNRLQVFQSRCESQTNVVLFGSGSLISVSKRHCLLALVTQFR